MRIGLIRLCFLVSLLLLFQGCGQAPTPRLSALLGTDGQQQQPNFAWPQLDRMGLIVHSDTTGPGTAPSISQPFLETLFRRSEEYLTKQCMVSSVVPIPFPSSPHPAQIRRELIASGLEHGVSHLLLVVFSGTEHGSPTTLGEERMMTQMSGTMVENTALAEVVALRLSDYKRLITLSAGATEALELLDAPLGEGAPSREQSLNILRAQTAQQALDRSFNVLRQWCEGIPKKD